jgi:hypothetical protein
MTLDLTDRQLDFLRGLVRGAFRKRLRGRDSLRTKYADTFDSSLIDERLVFILDVYHTIGGNPANITIQMPELPRAE